MSYEVDPATRRTPQSTLVNPHEFEHVLNRLRHLAAVDRIRQRLASRFLVSLGRATHRMPARLREPERGRVLVIAPHMDDEAIACGGTLLRHRDIGSEVDVIFVSDSGGPSSDPEVRRRHGELRAREMSAAREILTPRSVDVLGFPDGRLVEHEAAISASLREHIGRRPPDVLLCPFPGDAHGDHQAVALAAGTAARDASLGGEIWAYEVWSTIWPTAAIDISRVAGEKERAIRCYASQIADRDYAAGILGLARYRGLLHRVEMAEAFYVDSAAGFARLAGRLNAL